MFACDGRCGGACSRRSCRLGKHSSSGYISLIRGLSQLCVQLRCSSRAWCWAVEARSYRVMDVLHELLTQLQWGLGSCDDRNLERLQWQRCHGVPLHKVCPLHVHVMECCRLGELGRRSVHVDGPLGVVCAVGLHILGDGNLSRKGVGWRWKAAGTRWAMDVSIH